MYKLSPSDFAYLYEDCKLCYWLKVKHSIQPPPGIFPGVFSSMNSMVQGQMVGHSLKDFGKSLPDIEVIKQEGFVLSKPVPGTSVFISGKYDLLCKNKDGTYTMIDLKISKPEVGKIEKYKTQLGSYKFALENPAKGESYKITKLALLIFYPEKVKFNKEGAIIDFPAKWFEIPIDEKSFISFIKEVDKLLKGDAPKESETCGLCKYRHHGEDIAHHIGANSTKTDKEPF
jgi:CRISPR/Cas system-associated exonuclease Cas4 (RecB family)